MQSKIAISSSFLLLSLCWQVLPAYADLDDGKAGYKDYRKIQEVEMDKDIDKLFDFGYHPDKAFRLKHDKLDAEAEDSRRQDLRSRFREFDVSHDFDQKNFSDTLDNDMKSSDPKEVDRQDNVDLDHDKDKDRDKDDKRRKDRRRAFLRDEELMFELSRLPLADPDDWVPDKADPVQNGGFSIAPDNGSVVPYKLNGWINLQRKFPWEDDD